jgi:hypothetical protein
MPATKPSRRATWLLFLAVSGALGNSSSAQQPSSSPSAADSTTIANVVRAVLSYRLYYMADSTPVSTCMLLDAMHGITDDPAAVLPASLAAMLDMPITQCGPKQTPTGRGRNRGHFVIQSIDLQDTVAVVHSSVRHGEYIHKEEYRLGRREQVWFVRDVTLSHSLQVLLR